MKSTKINLSFTKNKFLYFIFLITNLLIFLLLLFLFSQFDDDFRDTYTTDINIELVKSKKFYQANDTIFNIYKDFFIADHYFQKKILGFEKENFGFDIDNDYDVFFENLSESIFLKILRPYSKNNRITNLQTNTSNPINPSKKINNFINISFNSAEKISNEVLTKTNELINYNLDNMFYTIISRLNYNHNRNLKINEFIKNDSSIDSKDINIGEFINENNQINIEMLSEDQLKLALKPKITYQLSFIDFDNPIVFAYVPAIIFSILITIIIFYVIYVLRSFIKIN